MTNHADDPTPTDDDPIIDPDATAEAAEQAEHDKDIETASHVALGAATPENDAGIEAARHLVEEVEFGGRHHPPILKWCFWLLCLCWSLFQLYLPLPFFDPVDSTIARTIHLAFALSLVFISFPAFHADRGLGKLVAKGGWLTRPLLQVRGWPVLDLVFAAIAAACALYYLFDYEGINARQGMPLGRDVAVGWTLIALLLAAAWRALGPALPVIAGFMILLRFFGHLPFLEWYETDWWTLRPLTNTKFINQMTMSTEGIYGVPLRVSTTMVFLFVLFGAMLERAGGGRWFTNLAFAAVGRFRGGPGKAAVLASGMTGLVSGSSIANTVTTGTFTIPMMKKAGYPAVKAGAIEVAASTNGQLMPPIMGAAAFIIATYCNLPYIEVIKHAAVPALISYVALIYITHLEACKLGLKPTLKELLPRFWQTLFSGIHFLFPIVVLIVHLMVFRHSAELSALWAIGALALVIIGQEIAGIWTEDDRDWPEALKRAATEILEGLVAGARSMMGIGVAVAAAGIIVGLVNLGMGGLITELVSQIAGENLVVLLILTAFASLLLGMGLPTTANYIVMATLTAQLIVNLAPPDVHIPLIAAHLFVFYFGILADDTPPVGLAAFAASAISRADPIRTGLQGFTYDMRTAILPFMFIYNPTLLLIGVDTWYGAVAVFCTGCIAMFAFAALTQGWFLRKVRWWQYPLLAACMLTLLRHDIVEHWFNWPAAAVYSLGVAIFVITAVIQVLTDDQVDAGPPATAAG